MAYMNVVEVESALAGLAAAYPSLCHLITLPNLTHEGRTSHALRITKSNLQNPPSMLFIGGQHAREWGSCEILINFAADLLDAYDSHMGLQYGNKKFSYTNVKKVMQNSQIIIFPDVNPDGRNYSQTMDVWWRKNRNPIAGVDNNRNYDFLWDFQTAFSPNAQWVASTNPASETYHGTAPASEPENRNVIWLLDSYPQIRWMIDIHSYSGMISYNWGDDQNQSSDGSMNFHNSAWDHQRGVAGDAYSEFITQRDWDAASYLANKMKQALYKVRGVNYASDQSFVLPYPTSGTAGDYAYSRHFAVPGKTNTLGFLIEWGTQFQPPWTEMENIILDVSAALLEFAVDAPSYNPPEPSGCLTLFLILLGLLSGRKQTS